MKRFKRNKPMATALAGYGGTRGPQKPARFSPPVVYRVPKGWLRAASAITGGFL